MQTGMGWDTNGGEKASKREILFVCNLLFILETADGGAAPSAESCFFFYFPCWLVTADG